MTNLKEFDHCWKILSKPTFRGCSETSGGIACCYPGYVIQPKLDDDQSPGWITCEAKCVEPDGGVGY